jgi:peptidoglycan hydrolase CwlO-like protein
MSLEEWAKYPTAIAFSFCLLGLIGWIFKLIVSGIKSAYNEIPKLIAQLIIVIQNNTNMLDKFGDKQNLLQEEFNGLSKSMAALGQWQKETQREVSAINTNVIGVQTDVQVIKDNMVTRQELHNTVDKLYERGEKY